MKTTRKAIILILLASLCAGMGQLLWKKASFSLELNFFSLINPYLISGVFLYLLGTLLMTLSFREGELSVLHPFLATSYVWVTLISPLLIIGETLSIYKIMGISSIFLGISLIGIGGRKAHEYIN